MCQNPYTIKTKKIDINSSLKLYHVPCNKCSICRKAKYHSWLFRLNIHQKITHSQYFVTLTYNNENLPLNNIANKRDLQLYFKRLRKLEPHSKISYFAVSEYGSKYGRAHYHILLYNVRNPFHIDKAWGKGFVTYPILNSDSGVKYVLKYMFKDQLEPNKKVFSLVSKGIGENYLTKNIVKYHENLENCFLTLPNGVKTPMPKYYKEKLYSSTNGDRDIVNGILLKNYIKNQMNKRIKYIHNHPTHTVKIMLNNFDKEVQHNTFNPAMKPKQIL